MKKVIVQNKNIPAELKRFSSLNTPYWQSYNTKLSPNSVFLETFNSDPTYLLQAARVANAINNKYGYSVIALLNTYTKKKNNITFFLRSFNITRFLYFRRYFFNIWFLLLSVRHSFFVFCKYRTNIKGFIDFKFRGIDLGDLIYDTIIRIVENVYTIEKLEFKDLKFIFMGILRVYIFEKQIKKYNVKFIITSHVEYITFGILARVGRRLGAEVILSDRYSLKNYKYFNMKDHMFLPRKEDIDFLKNNKAKVLKEIDQYLVERFKGNDNKNDGLSVSNAYKNKKVYSRDDLKNELGITNNNPLVYVATHCFSDAPHGSFSILHNDYYQWYIDTLKIIFEIKNVNWIIKPHPSVSLYGEDGLVKKIYEENYKCQHIFLSPEKLSTISLVQVADVVLTVQGTIGLELSCMGIPCIITGKAFYSGFGFTIEPETIEEYISLLNNIRKINKLTFHQIEMAKLLMGWIKVYSLINDSIMPSSIILPGENIKERSKQLYSDMSDNLANNSPIDNFYLKAQQYI
jgi:hypothetical protein